jgi:hypothetical protein
VLDQGQDFFGQGHAISPDLFRRCHHLVVRLGLTADFKTSGVLQIPGSVHPRRYPLRVDGREHIQRSPKSFSPPVRSGLGCESTPERASSQCAHRYERAAGPEICLSPEGAARVTSPRPLHQTITKAGPNRVIETRIAQFKTQKVLPVNVSAHGFSGIPGRRDLRRTA